jgi:hypothetical protein
MPRLIITEGGAKGLERCQTLLREKNPQAMIRAAQVISHHLSLLEYDPEIGRPFEGPPRIQRDYHSVR